MLRNQRTKAILKTLLLCLGASGLVAYLKIWYGNTTHSLSFVADGFHMLFDGSGTLLGMISVFFSSKPPDEKRPYGYHKLETMAAFLLSFVLLFGAYEVGHTAYDKITSASPAPQFSYWGLGLIVLSMMLNLVLAKYEQSQAEQFQSPFLESDAFHNQIDFFISLLVLVSLIATHFEIRYVDAIAALVITVYLAYASIKILLHNIKPLVDTRILEPDVVRKIVTNVPGVFDCHSIRSRGSKDHHFLDLNIHLDGHLSLVKAHEITHEVEDRLKAKFPGLIDVVIHTEPHNHPPCSKC